MPLRTTARDTLPKSTDAQPRTTATRILNLLLPHHRTTDRHPAPVEAFPHQLSRITDHVREGAPVVFTLPGFPCKSPNPAKTLGHLPDMGERLSLSFLDTLCTEIEKVHPPGARVVICSDGHVFADLIRVPDRHIDAYGDELRALIGDLGLSHLSVFDLRDVLGDLPHDAKRAHIHDNYAPTLDALRTEVRGHAPTRALYRGITRFLVEDTAEFTGTRSALQRECRSRAYGVIQRSRAWGALIADHHPRAARLSIHPQPAGSAKFGIRLLDAPDAWTTPWHSAALREPDGTWTLMPRARAQRLGRLVRRDGRPSHFERSPGVVSGPCYPGGDLGGGSMPIDSMLIDTTAPLARAVAEAIRTGDVAALRDLLTAHPGLATARVGNMKTTRTLLHLATDWPGHLPDGPRTVGALVAAGADVNARFTGAHRETALHWAAGCDDVPVLDALLDLGADIEADGGVIGDGTPLADAVAFGQWRCARRLVERGARTTLWQAAALGEADRVAARFGPDCAPPAAEEVTAALWCACHGGQQLMADYLLRRGGDINWIGYDRLTALDAARRRGHHTLVAWLREQGAKSAEELV